MASRLLGHRLDCARDMNRVVKSHYNCNRPFITVVGMPNGELEIHTNTTQQHERIDMLLKMVERLRAMS